MLERSLEIAEVLRGGGSLGDDEDRKPVCTYFGKRFRKVATSAEPLEIMTALLYGDKHSVVGLYTVTDCKINDLE